MIKLAINGDVEVHERTKHKILEKAKPFLDYGHNLVHVPDPLTEEEKTQIMEKVLNDTFLVLEEGITVVDKNAPFEYWLSSNREKIEFRFWERYRKYLLEKKGWAESIVSTLDRDSEKILELLGNPKDVTSWLRHGLLIGDVQSGKTANYTSIINKAADAGYQVIVVLAGTTEILRRQTQDRLEKEFLGMSSKDSSDDLQAVGHHAVVGVGKYDSSISSPVSFTSTIYDFRTDGASQISQTLSSGSTYLFVLKKNKTILNNLHKWLSKNNPKKEGAYDLSLLLIDDESDNASVNTNKPEKDPTAINAAIRHILASFSRASYLAVTATPYANIFIDSEFEDENKIPDLFPKDYIHMLKASPEYIGAEALFSEYSPPQYKECIKKIRITEIEEYLPIKHKKDSLRIDTINSLPPSLIEAVRYFLLVQGLMDYNLHLDEHRSMLINVSRFTAIQNDIRDVLQDWLKNNVMADVRNYYQQPQWAVNSETQEYYYLYQTWKKYRLEELSRINWDTFSRETLWKSISKVEVVSVNQSSVPIDYSSRKDGLRIIAVGGFSLSRGLTLEGLVVSYFYRNSMAYDTLMQMGRWFGYRKGYLDYFKIWMSDESVGWYSMIVEATQNLRNQITVMNQLDRRPMDFGLAVQRQPLSRLIITARNKMIGTEEGRRLPIIINGRLVETPRLYNDREINQTNEILIKKFIKKVDGASKRIDENTRVFVGESILWTNIPNNLVVELVENFKSHRWNLDYQSEGLSKYISIYDKKNWDVALVSIKGDNMARKEKYELSNDEVVEIQKQARVADLVGDMIRIGKKSVRVGPGGISKTGLSVDVISEIEGQAKQLNKRVGDLNYLQVDRNPIVFIYSLYLRKNDEASSEEMSLSVEGIVFEPNETVFAIGLGFPVQDINAPQQYVQYFYNPVAVRQALGIDDFVDEEVDEDD